MEKVNLIDVRTPTEFNAGSVPSAINIPLNEVVNRLDELKELQPILVFCAASLVVCVSMLFGGKKIPQLMKGLGQGIKEFKSASNESDASSKDVDNKNNKEEK